MSVLKSIIEAKALRLEAAKRAVSLPEQKSRAKEAVPVRDFAGAIKRQGRASIKLIAELKKASPSKGLIRPQFDPAQIAQSYAQAGAHAMSVLTEQDRFQGELAYIAIAKQHSPLPALRKDFLFDPYQLYEARAAGADAVLLIDAALELSQAQELMHLARELGMAVLYEVHDEREMERARRLNAPIIGINNRNLKTLAIDLETTFRLMSMASWDEKTLVSESGIETRGHVQRLEEAGVDAILVGTSLMKSPDICAKVAELLGGNG